MTKAIPPRRRVAAALLLAASLLSATASAAAAGGPSAVLVSTDGVPSRSSSVIPSSSNGVVCVLTEPGVPSPFGTTDGSVTAAVAASSDGTGTGTGPVVISAPTATLGDDGMSGRAGAAASVVAGSVVLSGPSAGDVEGGLEDTRFGRTLSAIFAAKLASAASASASSSSGEEKTLLIIAVKAEEEVDGEEEEEVDEGAAIAAARASFDAEAAAAGREDAKLEDLYEVEVMAIRNDEDATAVMDAASAAAPSRSPSLSAPLSSVVADAYSAASATGTTATTTTTPESARAILACDESYARHRRSLRARLAAWKSRASRGLPVEGFGSRAASALNRAIGGYDRDTCQAAGLTGGEAARYRLEVRERLKSRGEGTVKELFELQVESARRKAIKRFEAALLKGSKGGMGGESSEYRASARRVAALAFENAAKDLEVPSLGLVRSDAVRKTEAALNDVLMTFEDSPAARLRAVSQVQRAATKERKPSERAVDVKLDLVAMVRPDGYGNLQGFVGYQLPGGNQVTVGFQNDADSPDVIGQFGGVRPPFLRVQPKLKLDVEL